MDTQLIVVIGIVVLVFLSIGAGIWAHTKATKSQRLKAKETISRLRDRELAKPELHQRERRVEGFHIEPEDSRHRPKSTAVQRDFLDDPQDAAEKADQLFHEIMKKRGYPVTKIW
jgi:hypothetical protein